MATSFISSTGLAHSCLHDSTSGKNLAVFIDGTAFDKNKGSNVVQLLKIFREFEGEQLACYVAGIGAKDAKKYVLLDQAVAFRVRENIIDGYKWLCEKYEVNDKIFLFGFSRGAYQVRVLAGMIQQFGLIGYPRPPGAPRPMITREGVEKIYEQYTVANSNMGGTENPVEKNVKVHFIGVWDTVSSIWRNAPTLLERNMGHMDHVCAFRHALALDERRSKFLPEFAIGREHSDTPQNIKEVWFVGCHSDVGGRKVPEGEFIGPALRWMVNEAISFGLKVQPYPGKWPDSVVNDSMTSGWKVYETFRFLPNIHRVVRHWKKPRHFLGEPRLLQPHQHVHLSAFDIIDRKDLDKRFKPYTPIAQMPNGTWTDVEIRADRLENDSYATAREILDTMRKENLEMFVKIASKLVRLTSTAPGRQAITEHDNALDTILGFMPHLRSPQPVLGNLDPETLISALVDVLNAFPFQPMHSRQHTYASIRKVVTEGPDKLDKLLQNIGKLPFYEHTREINSVAYSPSGAHIASGSGDSTIRIWDATDGDAIREPFKFKEPQSSRDSSIRILSMAFSHDNSHIVSGSSDGSVCRWDVATGEPTVLGGHQEAVYSVAFSPDGGIASGSADGTIQIRSVEPDQAPVELKGHLDIVLSIAFSIDRTLLVSGSRDKTARVWKRTADDPLYVFSVRVYHKGPVNSVACSPDGHQFASGSDDRSCCLWDVETGKRLRLFMVPPEISGSIMSVAFSPNGGRLAAASRNEVVIWNQLNGNMIHRLRGHAGIITSLAVWQAPRDGEDHERKEHIVTASWDKTLRVWDMQSGRQLVGAAGVWTATMMQYEHAETHT